MRLVQAPQLRVPLRRHAQIGFTPKAEGPFRDADGPADIRRIEWLLCRFVFNAAEPAHDHVMAALRGAILPLILRPGEAAGPGIDQRLFQAAHRPCVREDVRRLCGNTAGFGVQRT